MNKCILFVFLTVLLRAADTPSSTESSCSELSPLYLQISSYEDLVSGLTSVLGSDHNWDTTAIGFDFDDTIAHRVLNLPCNKRMDHLLSCELLTMDNVIYPRALGAHRVLGVAEEERLSVVAYQRGGYFKLKEEEQKKNYAQLMDSVERLDQGEQVEQVKKTLAKSFPYAVLPILNAAIQSDIEANKHYEYMEPHELIKRTVKALQLMGAFVGVCSVGNKDEARDSMQRGIGIKEEHWAQGDNKFKTLLNLATVYAKNRKNPEAGPFKTFILFDNFAQGTRDFANDASRAGFKGIGVYYDRVDKAITTESLIKEFKDVACQQEDSSTSSSVWQNTVDTFWSLGGY